MKEKEIEKILVDEVRKLGGRAYKWVSPGNNGVPDRIVILPDRDPYFVELKTDTGRLSPTQKIQIDRLIGMGQQVSVVRGVKGVEQFFRANGFAIVADKISKRYQRRGVSENGI